MLETTNYKLKKIELADSPPDITAINPNWDTIDAKLKTNEEQINTLDAEVIKFKGTLTSIDLNIIDSSKIGEYVVVLCSNCPIDYGILKVEGFGTYTKQTVTSILPTDNSSYYRTNDGSGYTAWIKNLTDKQPDWIAATLQNGWLHAPYDAGNRDVSYFKDSLGMTHIKGTMTGGIFINDTLLFKLPQGYRPIGRTTLSAVGYRFDATYIYPVVSIYPNGDFALDNPCGADLAWLWLPEIIFRAEQ